MEELSTACRLALEAGELLRQHLAKGVQAEAKTSPEDPVTAADREASALIVAGLEAAFPNDGLLSEEEADAPARLSKSRLWLIDPIDGTRHFAEGRAGYAVSIGLVVDGEPVLGAVYAPASDQLYAGAVGQGVTLNGQPTRLSDQSPYRIAVSSTEHGQELADYPLTGMVPSGSVALKLARLAAGQEDATFTMSPRSEWDIAAGHALLRAAGGDLLRRDGQPVRYNAARPHLEQGIVAGAPAALAWLQSELARLEVPVTWLGLPPQHPLAEPLEWTVPAGGALHVRLAGEKVRAAVMTQPDGQVGATWGDAFHLRQLTRDVVRAAGAFG